jgi:hypothetical protein
MLPTVMETKMVYLDFKREIPQDRLGDIQKQIFDQFDAKQLAVVMEKAGVRTPDELEAKLRSYGSSLYKTKRAFAEQVVAQQMVQRVVDFNPKITHEELREYYQQHQAEYATLAQVRWEQLMVRFDRFPSREAARQALAEMGNEVLRGAPLGAVARHKSQGFTADQGGNYDWTAQGSLVSKALDYYLFTLPIGRLSQIVEDEQGLHILRVIERRDAAQVSFERPTTLRIVDSSILPNPRKPSEALAQARIENSGGSDAAVETTVYVRGEPLTFKKTVVPAYGTSEVQFELAEVNPKNFKPDDLKLDIEAQTRIRAVIRQQKIEQQREEYLARLRERTPVWTIFGELPATETAASGRTPPR